MTHDKFPGESPSTSCFVKADAINDGCQLGHKVTLLLVKNVRPTLNKEPCFSNFHPTSKIILMPNGNILIEFANITWIRVS